MMTNKQASRLAEKPCNGCGQTIFMESRLDDDGKIINKPDGKPKWFCMEAETGIIHNCPNFKPTKQTSDTPKAAWKLAAEKIAEVKLPDSLPDVEKRLTNTLRDKCKALAFHKIAILQGVEEACNESGITHPATIGMIFNAINQEIINDS